MATSGTFNFFPSVGELVLNAYSRIQMRYPALTAEHWFAAKNEAGFLQIEWANKGVNLWTVDLQSITLIPGQATYSVLPNTVYILDLYITTTPGNTPTDRLVLGISRSDYAAQTNKQTPGPPTMWWFDRLISPTITFWPVPDTNGPYVANFYRYRMIQDAVLPGGLQPEIPWRWLDAWPAGLAHRLARTHRPELEQLRKADANEAWQIAADNDTENVPIRIQPMIGSYYRRR